MSEDGVECESLLQSFLSIIYLFMKKYYLQVYLRNCAYKIVDTQMVDYLDDILFEPDEN